MVNGYFDGLDYQRFASVELFFLPVLFKWLTVISMCLIISGLQQGVFNCVVVPREQKSKKSASLLG